MGNRTLAVRLRAKARLGRWDARYCAYFHVPVPSNPRVRAFITRGYAAGLVPTATTNGRHAAHSLHYLRRAADMGLRGPEVGTARGLRKMARFQKSEFRKRAKYHHTELIGPTNARCILGGRVSPLREHTTLEDAHDNHVHGGF